MTRRIAEVLAIGLALTLANAAAAETVKIGVIGTYSGGYARWGEQFKAIAVYQKQHGDSVNGNKIEIVYRDDEGPKPDRSKQLADDLINTEKVQFIAGFPWSPNATAIAPIVTEAK
ncbi:MAG: ABC transporter substrate-binding protein, partial [Xanthobacteraceae bacterium]